MLNQQELDIIHRYLTETSSESETEWVENLFSHGAANIELKQLVYQDWSVHQPAKVIDLSHIQDRVHHNILKRELKKMKSPGMRILNTYSRVAAVLLFPVLFVGIWFYLQSRLEPELLVDQMVSSTIYAPLGSRVSFNLPDGTTGFLNSGSSLSYTIPFTSNRNVTLEGEAWFDVAHDEQHPFEIGAGTSAVRVLGTSFNLSAYPNEDYMEVVLGDGMVEFSANTSTPTVRLNPSERLIFTGDRINIETADPAKFGGWTEGKLIFRGDNMAEVARRLERWYNIQVVLADKALEEYVFRGIFEDDPLNEVLRLLSMTSPIRYTIAPRVQGEGDTWTKEKVTLYMKNL